MVGGVLAAISLVDGGQGSLVEPDGGYRQTSFLGQVGQVGGDQAWVGGQVQDASVVGPGLEGAPCGVVYGPGVIGDAVVQGVPEALDVGTGDPGCGSWGLILDLSSEAVRRGFWVVIVRFLNSSYNEFEDGRV